eukprot:CAMPEP_0174348090 /NCGR_PEP_ID=MMETSP0811_2-20130205/4417_1 /TAXON_ID=73025 ORGANISM="Eutreptiella gymnastica-like, Strain CCMP1594" /NCGR_SAMPLE_ID=MMETSP0811_2 /ASSEMBLY_ACC=CAM_ASM_000667 /LENGTH=131 /DNA_ID=CAMNT_0015474299 /DNA_START=296 /DNA_END=689 /DNA_ORIENTATION=+
MQQCKSQYPSVQTANGRGAKPVLSQKPEQSFSGPLRMVEAAAQRVPVKLLFTALPRETVETAKYGPISVVLLCPTTVASFTFLQQLLHPLWPPPALRLAHVLSGFCCSVGGGRPRCDIPPGCGFFTGPWTV